MAEMYVGNATVQIYQFCYRVPEKKGIVIQTIPIGGQVKMAPVGTETNLSTPVVDSIVAQGAQYGMIDVANLDIDRTTGLGLCYSIGKPISPEKLHRAMLRNQDYLERLGKKMREEAAVAVNNNIENIIQQPLRGLEMVVAEEIPQGGFKDETAKHVSEGIRVVRDESKMTSSQGHELITVPAKRVRRGR